MRRRLLVLVAAHATCLGTALVAVPLTTADAVGSAFVYKVYTMCDDDADGKLCVESVTRNGATRTVDYPDAIGPTEWLYVDNGWRNGVFSFNLNTITRSASPGSTPVASKDVDLDATWTVRVNTGSYVPRELNSKTRETTFTKGGNSTTGYWFELSFKPVPIAWRFYDTGFTCDMDACGNLSTRADFVSAPNKGVADGFVTDLADSGVVTRFRPARTGLILTGNAQYQSEPYYNAETNSIVVGLANPHLRGVGKLATGYFEAFLPDAYLVQQLGVPDPTLLQTGSFTVTRRVDGTTAPSAYSATREDGGVRIKITTTFSRPVFSIKPKPKAPGKPRLTGVKKTPGAATVSFLPPLANGGVKVNAYAARCHAAGKPWIQKVATKSPITVTGLPPGTVYCQVKAHNAIGWGPFGKVGAS